MISFVKKVKSSTLELMLFSIFFASNLHAADSYEHLTLNEAVRIALENNVQQHCQKIHQFNKLSRLKKAY